MADPFHLDNLLPEERPRERLLGSGPESLSDRELLAVLLSTGPPGEGVLAFSGRVLDEIGGVRGLVGATPARLTSIRGVGAHRAAMLLASLEISRRCLLAAGAKGPAVCGPKDLTAALIAELGGETREVLGVFLLDARMRLLGFRRVSRGTPISTLASAREVFSCVLQTEACAVVLAHNHPSGDPTPSEEDVEVTATLVEAGRTLSVPVIDHLILGGERVASLRESGRMPP